MNDPRCLRNLLLILTFVSSSFAPLHATESPEVARWEREAANVTIVRDDWGIAHVYGKTDADAVFGMEYAQAEDDFNRVQTNYINAMGRLPEAEGESRIYQDLHMKLFIDPEALRREYTESPEWLQKLMNSFGDCLNFVNGDVLRDCLGEASCCESGHYCAQHHLHSYRDFRQPP